ncbi:MAG: cell envelope integrity protein TolA [Cephaloticoccus sp.]|nr:cell envelope integrity protein TolA [Cephaloticoccus sp.]
MQSETPSAFFLSLTLHGLIVALMLFFTYVVQQQVKETPKIFELVAGEGNNYAATEAPAAGAEELVKFNVPKRPAPVIRTAPPEPEVVPEPTPVKPVETKAPDFSKDVKRIADKREKRLVEADRKKRAAEEKKVRAAEAKAQTMTKAEFDKLHANQKNPTAAAPPRDIKVRSINIKGVTGGSTRVTEGAGGKALTREQGKLLDAYIALLLQRLRAAHVKPAGLSDLLQCTVQFDIAPNGTLSGVRITRSSGSPAFDQSVIEAFAKVRSIGPTPDGKGDTWEVAFKMREDG